MLANQKALTWLCLIENIGNRCSSYLTNVIIPFLNYCFGLSSESMTHETESISSQTDNLMKSKRAGTTIPSTATTTFSESLYKIGIEFYVSFLCNGSRDNIPADIIANGLKNSS